MGQSQIGFYNQPQSMNQVTDQNSTTVLVGEPSIYVAEEKHHSFFQGFGEIIYSMIMAVEVWC